MSSLSSSSSSSTKPVIHIWPHGKVIFAVPLALVWILFYVLVISGVNTPWFARLSALATAVTLVIVFMDFRRDLALITLGVSVLCLVITYQALGVAVLWDMRDAVERFGTGYSAEFHFLLGILILIMLVCDLVNSWLNRRIRVTDTQIELLRPGDGDKLFDLDSIIVTYERSDWLEYAMLRTGKLCFYTKSAGGSDKGVLIISAEHVRHADKLYDRILEIINAT